MLSPLIPELSSEPQNISPFLFPPKVGKMAVALAENKKQAEVRADPEGQNKGGGAAAAALHLIALARKWGRQSKGIGFKPFGQDTLMAGDTDGSNLA